MTKIEMTKKVSETNYYSNTTDTARQYDVNAKVTIGGDTPHIEDGTVTARDGDVIIATFSKPQYGSLTLTFAAAGIPATETVTTATAAICAFIEAIKTLQ